MKNFFTFLTFTLVMTFTCQAQFQFGNGTDGNFTVNDGEEITINTHRTTVTGINYPGSTSILVDSTGGIQAGDEIMIICMADSTSDMSQNAVGQWETHYVTSTGTNVLNIDAPLQYQFDTENEKKNQVVKIPNYTEVLVSGTLTCPDWDGNTGGILAFRSNTHFEVSETGIVDASFKGYRGYGEPSCYDCTGHQGEGIFGNGGIRTRSNNANAGGGGNGGSSNGGWGGGGGGYATAGEQGQDGSRGGYGGIMIENPELKKLFFGGAGGSGGRDSGGGSGDGGNGGGIVYISSLNIDTRGQILGNGENGHNSGDYDCGSGGSGAGGTMVLAAATIQVDSTISSLGGIRQTGGYDGGAGSEGMIKLSYINLVNNSGEINPEPTYNQMFNIFHVEYPNTNVVFDPYMINAQIMDTQNDSITEASLFYRINGGLFVEVNMVGSKNYQNFSAEIPGQAINTTIDYYLTATDGNDMYSLPLAAPADLFSFKITGYPPDSIHVTDNNDGSANITWSEPVDLTNFVDYSIYRSEQENFNPGIYNLLAENVTDTIYTDTTVVDFHTYYYKVSANYDYSGTLNESFSDYSEGLLVNNTTQTTVLGYAYLEGRNNHANIKIKFVPLSPSAVADSIYTNALGYFETHDIYPGVYTVLMSKDNFETPAIWQQISIVEDLDMEESILYDYGLSVSGDVSGAWDGYVTVNGDITVPTGDSLIIGAGTWIRFTGKYHMKVYGYLECNGTEADTVLFTVWPTRPHAANTWHGIDFYDLADDNSFVKYTKVEYAYDGIYYEWCRANLEHSHFRINARDGIYLNRSDGSSVLHCEFSENANSGFWMDYSTATIQNCIVRNNPGHGISLYNVSYATISFCTFNANLYGVVANGASNPLVDSCVFVNNTNDGIHFNTIRDRGVVTNCTFEFNGVGIDLYYQSRPKINNNYFNQNNYGIEIQYDCDATISENLIVNNSYGIVFNSSGYNSETVITNNIIAYNHNDGIYKNTNNSASSPTITNNTIFGNGRHGLYINKAGTEVIRNNIIAENLE